MIRFIKYSLFYLMVLATLCVSEKCWADESPQSQEFLRKSYFRLKNIDPEIKDPESWRAVVKDYQQALKSGNQLNDKFYFDYGSLLQIFGHKTAESSALQDSLSVFNDLVLQFPNSSLADDALVKKAEILVLIGAGQDEVVEAYNQVLRRFPNSDMAEVAKARLRHPLGFKSTKVFKSPEPEEINQKQAALKKELPTIVLDPGHGGEDFGAENDLGLLEKDVVLAIALETERLIKQREIAQVVLTRRQDVFVPLLERVAIANRNNAALFLSLHNNASPKRNQSGFASYVLDDSSDEASRLLAERENKSAGAPSGSVSDLDFIVSDLMQTSKHPKSILLAEIMERTLMASVKPLWPKAQSVGIKKAPFYVLVGAHMPCALLELFFLDHENDGERLTDPEIRSRIAEGITRGVDQFLARARG